MADNQGMNYALPVENDAPHVCVTLSIPGDIDTISNFIGALNTLAYWSNYRRDDAKRGKDIAAVWKEIVMAVEFDLCSVPPQPIISGEEWEDELAICESLRWNDGVLEGFCCGEWVPIPGASGGVVPGPVVQPPGQSRPTAGESACFNVALSANDRWQLPFPVLPGDIVTISNISGTWSDGGISPWYTPDGHTAIFGTSTGAGQGHDGGDPYVTPYHMALVAFTPSEDWQAQTDSPFTIGGSGSQQLTLQANDGSLDDNSGTISFRICVENGGTPPATEWCYYFDFKASPYGFVEDTRDGYNADWVSGQGWIAGQALQVVEIKWVLDDATTITEATIYGYLDDSDVSGSGAGVYLPVPNAVVQLQIPNAGVWEVTGDTSRTGTGLAITAQSGGDAANLAITGLLLRGTGTNPFGLDNC